VLYVTGFAKRNLFDNFKKIELGSQASTNALYCLKGANSMTMSGLACRKALVGTGRAISVLFGINGLSRLTL